MAQSLFAPQHLTYFLHIPKTAGTSFSQLLDQLVPEHTIVPAKLWSQLLPLLPYDWSHAQLLRGHFGYGIHRNVPKEILYVTFLRDPIERCISAYHHLCVDYANSGWVHAHSIVNPKLGLKHLLDEPDLFYLFDNRQTAHLGIDIDVLQTADLSQETGPYIFERSLDYSTYNYEQIFAAAQANLASFPWFGIQEYYAQSLLLLSFTFRIQLPEQKEKFMVLPGRPPTETFSTEELRILRDRNKYDQQLYDFGVRLFTDRFQNMLDVLQTSTRVGKNATLTIQDTESVKNALHEYLHT